MRDHVEPTAARSPKQLQVTDNMRKDGAAWTALTDQEAAAWNLAASQTTRKAKKGGKTFVPSGYQLFTEYTTRFLAASPNAQIPSLPPTGSFLGDQIGVTVSGSVGAISWTSTASNAPGIKTALMTQAIKGRHRKPSPTGYTTVTFVEFGVPPSVATPATAGRWACAIRFVEAATGREMGVVPIGTVTVALSVEQGGALDGADARKAA